MKGQKWVFDAIAGHNDWFHQIELPHDLVTPGVADSEAKLRGLKHVGFPEDMNGLRALDVGCMDGLFSLEMERRGASVVAIDKRQYIGSKLKTVVECWDSSIEYRDMSVYALSSESIGNFDIVLFLGVLYHLRHPLLALEALRKSLAPNGTLYINTLILDNFLYLGSEQSKSLKEMAPALLEIPLWQQISGATLSGDITNQFVPNVAAIHQSLADTNLELQNQYLEGMGAFFRCTPTCDQAIEDWRDHEDPFYHHKG